MHTDETLTEKARKTRVISTDVSECKYFFMFVERKNLFMLQGKGLERAVCGFLCGIACFWDIVHCTTVLGAWPEDLEAFPFGCFDTQCECCEHFFVWMPFN